MPKKAKSHEDPFILVRDMKPVHIEAGGKWMVERVAGVKEKSSFANLVSYARMLQKYDVPDIDIRRMFIDLYWDAFEECELNGTAEAIAKLRSPLDQQNDQPDLIR